MNWPYLHLTVNHWPVMVTALGLLVLVCAFVTKKRGIWMYAMATLALAGLSGWPIWLTGDQAEDMVQPKHIVSSKRLEEHHERATLAAWVLGAMGVVAIYGLWRTRRAGGEEPPPAWLRAAVGITALAGMLTVYLAALTGGHIVHGVNSLTGPPSIITPPPAPGDTVHEED